MATPSERSVRHDRVDSRDHRSVVPGRSRAVRRHLRRGIPGRTVPPMPVTVSMVETPRGEFLGWSKEGIRRARKLIRPEGVRLPARNAPGQAVIAKMIAHDEGVIGTRADGSKVRCQVWADHPHAHCVWLKVYEGDATYRGGMWIGEVDASGRITSVNHTAYDAYGQKICAERAA